MTTSLHLHLHPHSALPLRGYALLHPYAAEWLPVLLWAAILLLVWLRNS